LFLNQHGDPFSYDGFSQIFQRNPAAAAGVDRLQDPPRAQHRAHQLAARRVDIATLSKLAGHKDIAHTEHYLGDITPEELARIPDAFGKVYGRRVS